MDSKKINKKSMESLVKSGAFDSINNKRGQLFESIELLLNFIALNTKLNSQNQSSLFPLEQSISLPELINASNWDEKEILRNELDVLGFYVTNHPMEKYADELKRIKKIKDSESIKDIEDGKEASIAGVVRTLKVRNTKSGSGIFGNLVLEDLKGSVEAVLFNDLLRKSLSILEDRTEPIILKGIVENTEDRTKLRATDISSLKEIKSLSTLNILLSEDKTNSEYYSKLQKTFSNFPGDSKINLKIETNQGRAVIEVGEYKVCIDDLLIEELESILGEGTVSIS
jgi:DNA polymerase-3 subunit alpha